MTGMTLNQLKRTMATYDEIEFSYRGEMYDFQKDTVEDSRIKISVWHCTDKPECVSRSLSISFSREILFGW